MKTEQTATHPKLRRIRFYGANKAQADRSKEAFVAHVIASYEFIPALDALIATQDPPKHFIKVAEEFKAATAALLKDCWGGVDDE